MNERNSIMVRALNLFRCGAKSFDLQQIFQIFDDYLFRGALRSHVRLVWIADEAADFEYYGKCQKDPSSSDRVLIRIVEPCGEGSWTTGTVQHLLSILLHEMGHAVFQLFECVCIYCQDYNRYWWRRWFH